MTYVLVRASEMCPISCYTTLLSWCGQSFQTHYRTDNSLNNTFPKMVTPVTLLMCKEVLWSCHNVTHKWEEDAVGVYKMERNVYYKQMYLHSYMICHSQTAPLRELWYTPGVYSPLNGPSWLAWPTKWLREKTTEDEQYTPLRLQILSP